MPHIAALAVDVEQMHALDAESRRFAMLHLAERFEQLREVARHLRAMVLRTAAFYDTLDLSDTLDTINAAAAEATDSMQVNIPSEPLAARARWLRWRK